jgi:hypothetical protein
MADSVGVNGSMESKPSGGAGGSDTESANKKKVSFAEDHVAEDDVAEDDVITPKVASLEENEKKGKTVNKCNAKSRLRLLS